MTRVILALLAAVLLTSGVTAPPRPPLAPAEYSRDPILQGPEAAEYKTGTPREITAGIRFTESSGYPNPRHKIPSVKGAYGIDERYHGERAAKYGEYDPEDPWDAAYITACLYQDNSKLTNTRAGAIAAHLQGPTGVHRDGIAWWYVCRVLGLPAIGEDDRPEAFRHPDRLEASR
jgi:hypothetical protein